MEEAMKLKSNCGYWEIDNFPIGHKFERAGVEGLEVERIIKFKPIKGCNAYGYTKEGKQIAFSTRDLEIFICRFNGEEI